jgi:RHS repeat-associated protein
MEKGETGSCPFRYQGQYEDKEIGLYYNRFRYYSPEEGMYISQDPIRLEGGSRLYGYVDDPNIWLDILGLAKSYCSSSRRWRNTDNGQFTTAPIDPSEMVKGGRIDFNNVSAWANHHGLSNNWSPSATFPTGGFSYTLNTPSGRYKMHGHGTNPNAVANFPGSNSASGPTTSIKDLATNQNYRTSHTWGSFGSDPNGAHIPLDNSPY